MKVKIILALGLIITINLHAQNKKTDGEYYKIIVYHFISDTQQTALDSYLRDAYLPALHNAGIAQAGVFKPISNDTAIDKKIYVFYPVSTVNKLLALPGKMQKDPAYAGAGKNCLDAVYNQPCFARAEVILLQAFRLAPKMNLPVLKNEKKEHVYELRSYESPTEKLYENKVTMFNEGGEITLFKRLGFNAVFYANVISGSHMPNLMYMTSFENMDERTGHWKTFVSDPEWKRLSSLPEYQHNVSRADIVLMRATDYSDF
jgi:hypothetical protein